MIFKIIFIVIFLLLLIYSFLRPFSSLIAKALLFSGSLFGILTLLGMDYLQSLADFFGIIRAEDLYLFMSIFILFLFLVYLLDKIHRLNNKITMIVKKSATYINKEDRNKE